MSNIETSPNFHLVATVPDAFACSSADPFKLPEPLSVTLTCLGDTEMYRTYVVKNDGRVWPFFLTKVVYQQLVDFVRELPGPDPQVSTLIGLIEKQFSGLLKTH
jgi:hypothetical protein